jgi:hypothetical protein
MFKSRTFGGKNQYQNPFDQYVIDRVLHDPLQMGGDVSSVVLQRVDGFPYILYHANLDKYIEAMSWYTGDALKPLNNSKTDLYPLRLNPIRGTVQKHAYALFGEVQDDGRPLVLPKLVVEGGDPAQKKAKHKAANVAEGVLNRIWWENFGRTLMMRQGILSQILGGCIFHVRYVPEQKKLRSVPLMVERVSPEHFVGIPMPGDEYRLQESWIVKPITYLDAARYGVEVSNGFPAYWIEHWELDKYSIHINEHLIKKEGVKPEGDNPWGLIPTVYIPHIRANEFYGENIIDHLVGLTKELNLRWADLGDAHNADTHAYAAMRNVSGTPEVVHYPGLDVLDLGSSDGLGANNEPDAFEIRKPAMSEASIKYLNALIAAYRGESFVPAVADGEDEGSQRSAATLVARMWPLVSHINTERVNWSCGLDWLSSIMLRILESNSQAGITQEHLEMRIRQSWAPILPKDREVFVNELVNRAVNGLGSPEHLLEMTGDVEDVDQELQQIKDWEEFQAKLKSPPDPAKQQPGSPQKKTRQQ